MIKHSLIQERIKEICQTESEFANTIDSQEKDIYPALELILEKKDGKVISYPQDFSFSHSEVEHYEYIKVLILLVIR